MGRAKIKRGSTNVDMTAMCDVAFLLLTFFILATQFKPSEAVEIVPPGSVSNTHAPQKNAFTVSIDKNNRVFINMTDEIKGDVFDEMMSERHMTVTPDDRKYFIQAGFIGVPLNQLLQFIRVPTEQLKNTKFNGVPVDSTNNELQAWIGAAVAAGQGKKLSFLIKGDDAAKYPTFGSVIEAFKKNDIYKYNLVTNAIDVPEGSELYKLNLKAQQSGTASPAK